MGQRKSPEARLRKAETIKPSVSGERALELSEKVCTRYPDETFNVIAKSLNISSTMARQVARLKNLDSEVREMLRNDLLRYSPAVLVARYPQGVQRILAHALIEGRITSDDIDFGNIANNDGTLRERFEQADLKWPIDLNDDGTPKKA